MCGKLSGSGEWRIMKGIPPKIVKLIDAFDEVYDWLYECGGEGLEEEVEGLHRLLEVSQAMYAHTKEIMQGIESKWK